MHSLIKTALVAAIGVAVASASPAFAAKSKRGENVRAPGYQDVYAHAPGYAYAPGSASPYDALAPAPFWNDPANAQIVAEYLKDPSVHNGNL